MQQTYGKKNRGTNVTKPGFQVGCQQVQGSEEKLYKEAG